MRSFGRSFAAALIPRRIRVNVLTPGLIDTPLFHKMPIQRDALVSHLQAMVPMRRPGTSQEAAAAALFLVTDEAAFMTGSELVLTGGQSDL